MPRPAGDPPLKLTIICQDFSRGYLMPIQSSQSGPVMILIRSLILVTTCPKNDIVLAAAEFLPTNTKSLQKKSADTTSER